MDHETAQPTKECSISYPSGGPAGLLHFRFGYAIILETPLGASTATRCIHLGMEECTTDQILCAQCILFACINRHICHGSTYHWQTHEPNLGLKSVLADRDVHDTEYSCVQTNRDTCTPSSYVHSVRIVARSKRVSPVWTMQRLTI